jgi:hypothetical protein
MWLYHRLSPHSSRTPTAILLLHFGKIKLKLEGL